MSKEELKKTIAIPAELEKELAGLEKQYGKIISELQKEVEDLKKENLKLKKKKEPKQTDWVEKYEITEGTDVILRNFQGLIVAKTKC